MKKFVVPILVLALVVGAGTWYYRYSKEPDAPTVTTSAITRGDIVETVGATGTLQAVTTVQVGSQVSGNIAFLGADFNSLVKKGQVLARLDPSLFQAQEQQSRANLSQARANLVKAQSDLERTRVQLIDAQQKYARAKELSARSLLPQSDLDTAKTAVDTAQATLQSQQATISQVEAAITQAQAGLNQSQVNLEHTVIQAPIDGLVISRNVDVGQTVAASMQAPTLFVLAADLTKMQVVANLDESDVGRIRPGQVVTFRVDAYPNDAFRGTVSQVRLQPVVQQNVVTYATVIDVPNGDLRLKPGMTANVNVEIFKASNVLRVPNSALRYRPSNEVFAALGQASPELQGRGRAGGSLPGDTPSAASQTPASVPPAASDRAAGRGTTEARGDMPQLTPGPSTDGQSTAQPGQGRRRSAEQRREQGSDPNAGDGSSGWNGGQGGNAGQRGPRSAAASGGRGGRGAPAPAAEAAREQGATTIDALFAPLPRTESVGRAWVYAGGQLSPVRLRLGIADGQNTEIIDGDVQEGTNVITNIAIAGQSTRPATTAFPGFGGRGGGGGGNRGPGGR